MSPPERRMMTDRIDPAQYNPRRAAVLMLVYPDDQQATLALIRRNSYKGVHASQIAFPGGKIEHFDSSPLETALRETDEEIGVLRTSVSVVQPFSEVYIPPSNFCVSPFLGYCPETPVFLPDAREVAGMVALPLWQLLDDRIVESRRMSTSYSTSVEVPAFMVGGNEVWGATAMMLSELKEVLKAALLL
jgi:8-oxo-dGTP pyrophosphatase MutT (NUDIX family)